MLSWLPADTTVLYRKSNGTTPDVGSDIRGVGGGERNYSKMLEFYVQVFMRWEKLCQASYLVRAQVLFCIGIGNDY